MSTYFGKIDTYFVNLLSPKAYSGKRIMNLSGSFGKAIIWFLPESSALPDNRKRPDQDVFDVYYHMDAWGTLIDVLRNESPVYFNYYDSLNTAQIYTGKEPVGEEEKV